MTGAGLYVESAKGECNLGQHEIAFRYADALTTCDNHSIYKTGAKEIAQADGMSLTFMAKYDEREGNSCHIHISLRSPEGDPVLAGDGPHGFSPMMEHFLAGLLAAQRELTYFFAPNINSYKRFVPGSFAPTAIAWGEDNRTCAFRVVGHGESLRVEDRVAGGDVNPYLAVAALIAAGLHGIEQRTARSSRSSSATPTTRTSRGSRPPCATRPTCSAGSELAQAAFGPEVVDHYLNAARIELAAYDAAVTDWERFRGFERL